MKKVGQAAVVAGDAGFGWRFCQCPPAKDHQKHRAANKPGNSVRGCPKELIGSGLGFRDLGGFKAAGLCSGLDAV